MTSLLLYPDTRLFKVALWNYLKGSNALTPIVNISQDHPKNASDIQSGKSRIVLTPVNDSGVGKYLTRSLCEPTMRFTAYSVKESSCDNAIQQLMYVLESWQPSDFAMVDQYLQFIAPGSKIETLYNDSINLYFASITYKFYLRR